MKRGAAAIERSAPAEAVARDAKAARLANAVLATAVGLDPAKIYAVLADPATRRAAERAAGTRQASELTWGLAAGMLVAHLRGT